LSSYNGLEQTVIMVFPRDMFFMFLFFLLFSFSQKIVTEFYENLQKQLDMKKVDMERDLKYFLYLFEICNLTVA